MTGTTMNQPLPSTAELDALRTVIAADLPAYLADLERLVNIDCGSYTPAGVDTVGRWVAGFPAEPGAGGGTGPDPPGRPGAPAAPTFPGRAGGPPGLAFRPMEPPFFTGPPPGGPF